MNYFMIFLAFLVNDESADEFSSTKINWLQNGFKRVSNM